MFKNERKRHIEILMIAVLSVVLAFGTEAYVLLLKTVASTGTAPIRQTIMATIHAKTFYMGAVLFFLIAMWIYCKGREVGRVLYQYRFAAAFVTFVICVIFEINGSSIGMWAEYLGSTDTGILAGASRAIRTDEWAVSTPMMLSQYHNASGMFPYFSETVRGSLTDVFLEYGQPVRSIAIIFRPFYWGYLFLSAGRGMAFFWAGRLIALFMVTFEFGMLLTKKKKNLSVCLAFLVTWSPVVQWWFAVNGLVEMLIFSELSILMLYYYMNTSSLKKRILYVAVVVICAGGFVLTMYPSWMVPIGYILLGFIIWVIWENYKNCKMHIVDWIIIAAGILILSGGLVYVFWRSWETIQSLTGTVYPGNRSVTGGGDWKAMFGYVSNMWYALTGIGTGDNVCESARFIDFFPICYIVPVILMVRDKTKDKLSIILLSISVIFGVWIAFGFPDILAKISLLSHSQTLRTTAIFGFCNILLLIRSLSLMDMKKRSGAGISFLTAAVCMIVVFSVCYVSNPAYFSRKLVAAGTITVFVILFYLILQSSRQKVQNLFCIGCCGLMLFSGLLVNPIRKGVDTLDGCDEVQAIAEIQKQNEQALWVMEDTDFPISEIGIAVGAATVNSTNIYPNLERWHILDQDREFEDIYNRYAHIRIVLKDSGRAEFQPGAAADMFQLYLTTEDLEKLGVTYIWTRNDLSGYSTDQIKLEEVKQGSDFTIYKIQNI